MSEIVAGSRVMVRIDGLVSMVRGLAETVRVVTADRDAMRHELGRLQSMLALDAPYAVHDVLTRLADAADHLHHDHNCDADGWEMTRAAAASARRIVAALVGYKPPDRDAEVDARIADAVAADRAAAGAWVRSLLGVASAERARDFIARSIEHGDHIGGDKPPLPSLRMTLLLRDELHRQIATLTAERDRRIDPVEHAREVHEAYHEGFGDAPSDYRASPHECDPRAAWREKAYSRDNLLARVGADVLAEVER